MKPWQKWIFWVATMPLVIAFLVLGTIGALLLLPVAYLDFKRPIIWWNDATNALARWYGERVP